MLPLPVRRSLRALAAARNVVMAPFSNYILMIESQHLWIFVPWYMHQRFEAGHGGWGGDLVLRASLHVHVCCDS